MIRGAIVGFLLLVFGALRLPIESALTAQHRNAYFHKAQLGLDLREQVGQLGFLAALSGFRSLVADLAFIQAHVAWVIALRYCGFSSKRWPAPWTMCSSLGHCSVS